MPPPFRADQLGSLLRPPELLEARTNISLPCQVYDVASDEEHKRAQREAIQYAVQKQLELSIRPICSGEYGRHSFYGGWFETLEGMTPVTDLPFHAFRTDFPTTTNLSRVGQKSRAVVVCTGSIRWRKSAYMDEWMMLRSTVPPDKWKECKITMPSPNYQHAQLKPGTAWTKDSGYTTDEHYFNDLGTAYAAEIKALYDAGCRNIQIDDSFLAYFCSSQFLQGCSKDGTDTQALLDLYLEAHNIFLRQRPGADLHMGTHFCRGLMYRSPHWVHGSYEWIAKRLFTITDYDTFYLEFDKNEPEGGFEPLKHLPEGKSVVLGLVSTKEHEYHRMEDFKAAVMEAAEVVAKGQGLTTNQALLSLALSPECGFSSGNRFHKNTTHSVEALADPKGLSMDEMWQNLVLVREAARQIWLDTA